MNIILLTANDGLEGDRVVLSDHRARHIQHILQSVPGDSIRLGMLGGNRGTGFIENLDGDKVELKVTLDEPPPTRHRFELVLALPRPKMLRRVLRTAAEFGVSHLHLINSARVEKSYWQSPLLSPERISAALRSGLERSADTVEPTVTLHKRFRPFIEDELRTLCAGRPCWITDPLAKQPLSACASEPAVVLVGPEGGFVPFEVELALSIGAHTAHLGGRILSVDTALTAALAQAMPERH